MTKPTLVVMAAGMGSRYGGLKQIVPVNEQGEILIDFSLYDAMMAGFEKVVFIIKKEIEDDVRAIIDPGAGKRLEVQYVYQSLTDLPAGYALPEGRIKPWGTGQAVLSAAEAVDGPFAVVNSDDYYGSHAFQVMYNWLLSTEEQGRGQGQGKDQYSLVGYLLKNTLTENGHVTRGVCQVDEQGILTGVDERFKIMRRDGVVAYEGADETWISVPEDATVSMNFWGFTRQFFAELRDGFPTFLDETLAENPLKGEYLLPVRVDQLIKSGKAAVKVMESGDRWYGITYPEDLKPAAAALQAMKDSGAYPEKLWR